MELVYEFERLWNSQGAPPDVFAFIGQHECPADALLAILRTDQRQRWRSDAPLRVEDYLSRLSNLPHGIDWKLQLALGEFEVRRASAAPVGMEEISSRFPYLSDTLREGLYALSSGNWNRARDRETPLGSTKCDRLSDEFEAAWQASGATPRLEDVLQQAPDAARTSLLPELLQIEFWWPRKRGEIPAWSDYGSRFLGDETLIKSLLERPLGKSRSDARLPNGGLQTTESHHLQGAPFAAGR